MSLSAPPNQQPPSSLPQPAPPLSFRQRLRHEADHWASLSWRRYTLLLVPIGIFVVLTPLLPITAYALWLWASSSWAWRDRWASLHALAWRGGLFVGAVLAWAALSLAQVWIFPAVTAALQGFWQAHLLGELSLMPLFRSSLLARTVLLLPLAPGLARYFEKIDPRTPVLLQRILTARDMEPKQPQTMPDHSTTVQGAGLPKPGLAAKPKAKRVAKAAPRESRQPHSENPAPPPKQITIDSSLASHTGQAQAKPVSSTHPSAKKRHEPKPKAQPPATGPDPFKQQIDWNDVAE